jgi:hypothetical protein
VELYQSFIWYDMAAMEDVNVEVQQEPDAGTLLVRETGHSSLPVTGGAGHGGQHYTVRLHAPQAPGMWFARAECRFDLMGMESEHQKFWCVTDEFHYDTMRLVADF